MPARILSLWQPWATLWVTGEKLIETRSWGTDYRGIVVVHAAKRFDDEQRHLCFTEPFASALARVGFGHPGSLPLGAILGWVDLAGCARMVNDAMPTGPGDIHIGDDPRLTEQERAFGNYAAGRFAWLTGPRRRVLAQSMPYRGGQGLRVFDDAAAAAIRSASSTDGDPT